MNQSPLGESMQYVMMRFDAMYHYAISRVTIRYDAIRYDTIQYDTTFVHALQHS